MTNNTDPVRERDMLAQAIRDAAVKRGIVRADADLTGPHLLMLCEDLASAPPSAPVGVDLSNWAQHYSIGPDALDALRNLLSLAQHPAAPVLAKHQPCGCVICTCEDEQQCQGCGAKHCGNRADHPPYVGQQPAAPHWGNVPELDDEQHAAPSGEAVAFVPVHPRMGPLWSDTYPAGSAADGRSPNYEHRPLFYTAPQQPAGVDGMVMVQSSDLKALAEFADRGMRGNPAKLAALRAKAILAAAQQQEPKS